MADRKDATAVERYLRHAGKVEVDDLDWRAAESAGLSEDEVFVLTYFADIEQQTLRNLRTLLSMRGAFEPDVAAFLTTWNYEEFFHGQALARLLAVTGHPLDERRSEEVGRRARFGERLERVLAPLASHLFAREFPAVYVTFGAAHELTTLRGYERLGASTNNPILATLSERIAKQERRHFAWYFQQARARMEDDPRAQRLVRTLLRASWKPVGAGVKSDAEVARLFQILFPQPLGAGICAEIDEKLGSLPGLAGIRLMRAYFSESNGQPASEVGPQRERQAAMRAGLALVGSEGTR